MNHRSRYTRVDSNHVVKKMKNLENWRKTVLFVCVVALAIDPLFFFIPVIDSHKFCFTLDKKLGTAVCVLRTFIDSFYVIHIIFHFITEIVDPRSQKSYGGELIGPCKGTRKRLWLFYFIIDIVSVLPIPQVVVLGLVSRKQRTASLVSKEILKWVMFCQYIPRSIRIYPIFKEVTRASGTVSQTKWVGAALNLFLYLLPSHVIGAFWYLSAIEKKDSCWREACAKTSGCNLTNLLCARGGGGDNSRFLNTSCPLIDPDQITNSTLFNFGMYIDALKSEVVESRNFPRKFFYCFWWGLRNLSALGQNLETSNSVGEVIFAIIICVSGLLLFAVLIGNVQKYLQSTTIRVDEREEKNRDIEKWMSYRMLPENLKERIRKFEDYKWEETRGIEEEALLRILPKDLRIETKQHFYMNILKRVPWLYKMDDGWLLEALCDRVKPVFYSADSYIIKEGDPVEEMLIVTRGRLSETYSDGGSSFVLGPGDICGDLLVWVLDPHLSSLTPTSNTTVLSLTDVEGFILLPDDLKFVASHFGRLHSDKLRYMFRFYSPYWRTWGARYIQAAWRRRFRRRTWGARCIQAAWRRRFRRRTWGARCIQAAWRRHFYRLHSGILRNMFRFYSPDWRAWGACYIQAAWRRHCRRKILRAKNDKQPILQDTQLNLGATLSVSRFVSKALRNQRDNAANCSSSSQIPLVPLKPADP